MCLRVCIRHSRDRREDSRIPRVQNSQPQDSQACPEARPLHAVSSTCLGCRQYTLGHRVCKNSQISQLDSLHNVPLLAAPTEDGEWTNRSTSTLEAKRWLLCVLKKALGKDPDATTIHCLKSTALSSAGKAGLGTEVRQVLGHHSTGKKSHEIYNRDLLAEPLRQLESLFQRIRTGAFLSDTSRSGMVTDKTVTDPATTYRLGPIQEEDQASCSESSSTGSSSTKQSSQDDELPGLDDPLVRPEIWNPNFKMFVSCTCSCVFYNGFLFMKYILAQEDIHLK